MPFTPLLLIMNIAQSTTFLSWTPTSYWCPAPTLIPLLVSLWDKGIAFSFNLQILHHMLFFCIFIRNVMCSKFKQCKREHSEKLVCLPFWIFL